jgi:hypothetical protein
MQISILTFIVFCLDNWEHYIYAADVKAISISKAKCRKIDEYGSNGDRELLGVHENYARCIKSLGLENNSL